MTDQTTTASTDTVTASLVKIFKCEVLRAMGEAHLLWWDVKGDSAKVHTLVGVHTGDYEEYTRALQGTVRGWRQNSLMLPWHPHHTVVPV